MNFIIKLFKSRLNDHLIWSIWTGSCAIKLSIRYKSDDYCSNVVIMIFGRLIPTSMIIDFELVQILSKFSVSTNLSLQFGKHYHKTFSRVKDFDSKCSDWSWNNFIMFILAWWSNYGKFTICGSRWRLFGSDESFLRFLECHIIYIFSFRNVLWTHFSLKKRILKGQSRALKTSI